MWFNPSQPLASLPCSLVSNYIIWLGASKVECLISREANWKLKNSSQGEVWNVCFICFGQHSSLNRASVSLTLEDGQYHSLIIQLTLECGLS